MQDEKCRIVATFIAVVLPLLPQPAGAQKNIKDALAPSRDVPFVVWEMLRERSSSTQLSFRLRASATSANGLGNAPAISAPEKGPVTKMSCDWRRQPLRCGRPISDARGRVLVGRPDKRPNRKSLFPYHVTGSRGRSHAQRSFSLASTRSTPKRGSSAPRPFRCCARLSGEAHANRN